MTRVETPRLIRSETRLAWGGYDEYVIALIDARRMTCRHAIITIVRIPDDAISDRQNEYGTFYRVEGGLHGPGGRLLIVTIWIQQTVDDRFRFVTLKPAR